MTGFGDVNVGDKVRLTHKMFSDTTVEGRVDWHQADPFWVTLKGTGNYSEADWDVEVLEPAPKPLPTEPGLYRRTDAVGLGAYQLTSTGSWFYLFADGVLNLIDPNEEFPAGDRDLVRLVPVSAVEEARNETVRILVDYMRGQAHYVRSDEIERKFLGGKA